jgi:hypothetical protein
LEQAQLLQQFMSNVQIVILEQAGQGCYMKATHQFHEELMKFLNRIKINS